MTRIIDSENIALQIFRKRWKWNCSSAHSGSIGSFKSGCGDIFSMHHFLEKLPLWRPGIGRPRAIGTIRPIEGYAAVSSSRIGRPWDTTALNANQTLTKKGKENERSVHVFVCRLSRQAKTVDDATKGLLSVVQEGVQEFQPETGTAGSTACRTCGRRPGWGT